jgi:hypothetical protein
MGYDPPPPWSKVKWWATLIAALLAILTAVVQLIRWLV